MRELSLHVLDLAENSVRANASLIEIEVIEDLENDQFILSIQDNGKGMNRELLEKVENPFCTTRTTRKVGLGISLLKRNCELCNGKLTLQSELGKGTKLIATMPYNHIDRLPLGDMVSTLVVLIGANPTIDWRYRHQKANQSFELDTRQIKAMLQDVPINAPEVMEWIKAYILEQEKVL